ncbi:MAG: hypothetical protein EBY18_22390 [Alphaproteobacteria bacterium]|nr:hypothetical protein [Alphaproteobacteria bacterium]
MFADDRGWISRIMEAIGSGLTAEAAVQKVHDDTRVRMQQVSDPVLRERLQDLDDLANRLLNILAGGGMRVELPENAILVCRSIGPTELIDYDRRKLRGLVMEEGSPTMHAVVVAKALDIPVVAQVQGALQRIDALDVVVLDADAGQIIIRPSDEVVELTTAAVEARARRKAAYAERKDLPSVTLDGHTVGLYLNAGFLIDMQAITETNAAGIGLYRTEMPFLSLPTIPDVKTQQALYRQVVEAAGERPVTFRTLDVGGDKIAASTFAMQEDNPAMGWRSIRLTLDRPSLLRQQRHRQSGAQGPSEIKVGTMLEVPSLLWQLDELMRHVDFISVGSNDLMQFLYAVDRGNTRVASRYDTLSPPMLRVLDAIITKCDAAGVEASICGEIAGQPLEALALVALGFRNLSMSASGIGPVRGMIRSLRLEAARSYVKTLLAAEVSTVRENLRAFARDHAIALQ